MNKLFVGFSRQVELPARNFLFIDDEIPEIPRARVFDLSKNTINPLKNLDYKQARTLADVLYTLYPQGESTLTVRNGKRGLLKALLTTTRLDKINADPETEALVDDLLVSPLLQRVLCQPTNFAFNPNSIILVRLNRAELGTFDALALGLILINHYKGQLVIPNFGFYGRDAHAALVHENRLIAGVDFLDQLPLRLRQVVLSVKDKTPAGALHHDAETLAKYAGLSPPTNGFSSFVEHAMA